MRKDEVEKQLFTYSKTDLYRILSESARGQVSINDPKAKIFDKLKTGFNARLPCECRGRDGTFAECGPIRRWDTYHPLQPLLGISDCIACHIDNLIRDVGGVPG